MWRSSRGNFEDAPSLDLPPMTEDTFDAMPESEPEPPDDGGASLRGKPCRCGKPRRRRSRRCGHTSRRSLSPRSSGGFDEAQIETVKRASEPRRGKEPPPMKQVVAKASKPGKWVDTLIIAVAIIIIGFSGYAVWMLVAGEAGRKAARGDLEPAGEAPRDSTDAATTPAPVCRTRHTAACDDDRRAGTSGHHRHAAACPHPGGKRFPVVPVTSTTRACREEDHRRDADHEHARGRKQAAAVPPASAADQSRYEAMAKEFATDKSGKFTIQFELVCEAASLTRALRDGRDERLVPPGQLSEPFPAIACSGGRYPTRDKRRRAPIAAIPQSLRDGNAGRGAYSKVR